MYDVFFFFKQKTAYEMRISDWSSDVCSSDLLIMPCPELLPPRAAQGGSSSAHLTRGYSHWIRERDVPVRTSEQMVRSIPRLAWARCRLAMCRSTRHRPLSGVSLLQGIRSLTARIAGRPRASFAALMLARASRSEEQRVGKECVRKCRSRW